MNSTPKSSEELQIERDLVRWPRAKWVAVVLAILTAQGALLFFAPRPVPPVRTKYAKEPEVTFVRFSAPSEWLALQDVSLFASANPRGFSGAAWMIGAQRSYMADDSLSQPSFLSFTEFGPQDETEAPAFTPLRYTRPRPSPMPLALKGNEVEPKSHLHVEGFSGRRLRAIPTLPVQYASGAVRATVVQALVDSDGMVFSARVIESSGSKGIDTSALQLSRKARFAPLSPAADRSGGISDGKLVFDWATLDATGTNGVAKALQR